MLLGPGSVFFLNRVFTVQKQGSTRILECLHKLQGFAGAFSAVDAMVLA